ncbi:PhnD/SsuA/transferrin family substrate-binding protein [Aeromonas hydrophila]|uniref:sensor histidine kinase n=1 Tax=Aeromonas hydrophila TaxID=644 RepID=UPI0023B04A30|nr:sensor histidine kinase [Aeromonas hydrophila]MDE8808747.1 PhnD/SsuA/transferrin family substrate-binding protein [Aeromonas hydrophila]
MPLLSLLLWLALSALPLRVQAAPPPSSPAPARQESAPSQATPVQALAEPIRIGVLATRGPALARAQWQPLLRWLAQRVPGQRFVLHPLGLDELAEAVAREHLDFVITNPGQSVSLARQYPLAWLATLKSPAGGDNLAIGAALVVPAQVPYRHWRDLEGQAVAAVSENAFGGYLAYRFEAGEQGVRLEHFFSTVQFTGFPLDRLIERLATGEVAAAIVPVCQLERMEREGKVARGEFRVLDDQAPAGFGCQSSTRLYPNWSFAKTERASPALALTVTRALYDLPADSEAAIAADSAGWTVPTSELAIDRLLKAMDRHPLQGPWWQAAWHWLRQHQQWGWGALALVLLLGGHHLLLQYLFNRSQHRLLKARHQLEQKGRQLAQARRLAELGELGANVAHEINQPLSAIANYSQGALLRLDRLAQDPAQASLRQALEQIGLQVQRITQTVNRLRARLQKRPPRVAPCDLPTLVTELRPLLEQMLAPLDVAFTLHWRGQPRRLPLDGTGMEQLLVNLIKNGAESAAQRAEKSAAKSAAKSARAAVRSPAHPPTQTPAQALARVELLIAFEAQRLLLEIRDNGAGLRVPATELQQAFYSDKPDGMGLGLAICREVVESHRGQFSLENLSPQGCLARVTLPVPPPETLPSSTDMSRN